MNVAALALIVPGHSIVQIRLHRLGNGWVSPHSWERQEYWEKRQYGHANTNRHGGVSIFVQHTIYDHIQSVAVYDYDSNIHMGAQWYLPNQERDVTLNITNKHFAYDNCLNHQFDSKDLRCCCPHSPCGRVVIDSIIKHAVPVAEIALIIHSYWRFGLD